MEPSAFVLAGGRSVRMGRDKALLRFGGRTLLERALELARSVTAKVMIVGAAEKYAEFGKCVEDQFPGQGPLAGIHAALRASDTESNLILAVDAPFVEPGFLTYMVGRAQASSAVVTVPRTADSRHGFHPLCALYRRSFAEPAEAALRAGRNKVADVFAEVETQIVEPEEISAQGFGSDMFRNLNTPDDLAGL